MSVSVTLTKAETFMARFVGSIRFDASKNRQDYAGATKDIDADIEGAAAEMAFAKWRRCYFSPSVNTFKSEPDVGWFEVRHTTLGHGSLILRESDADGSPFVLVTGASPVFQVRGWLWGREAKRAEFLRAPNGRTPAWFVPQKNLRDPLTLLEWDAAAADQFIEAAKQAFPGSHELKDSADPSETLTKAPPRPAKGPGA
jgi:hypothetical protein